MSQREFDVVTFGETMLRLSAPGYSRLEEVTSLDVRIGGSESNTAVALSRLEMRIAWWSKLPANPLGRRIENEIRRWGVDTRNVLWEEATDARAGLYFIDFGLPPRGIDVYYDRAESSASRLAPSELDRALLARTRLLHLTGITPALSRSCAETTQQAIALAKEAGTAVSFDVNYRAKLWDADTARSTLETLLPQVDLLRCSQADAQLLFDITGDGLHVAQVFCARYGVPSVVITCGEDDAVAMDANGHWSVRPHLITEIVDRIGRGDAFNAGVLWGYLNGDLQLGLEYGAAMAALKLTTPGDLLLSTRAEIELARTRSFHGIRR